MNYINSFNMFGIEAKEIPSIKGSGAPTTETEGAVGCLYMNTDNGDLYKCIASVEGVQTWVSILGDVEAALDAIIAEQEAIIAIQESLIGGDAS